MSSSKPKKALRGLFTKTEPDIHETSESKNTPLKNEHVEQVNNINPVEKNSSQEVSHKPDNQYTITQIRYNFDRLKNERNSWKENDYITFLNRIDNAQTEAFFLKGKLIAEVKERFYEGNKVGWKYFCEETLSMNYTTANQYIRVAQEFNETANKRSDFGFEHFKALLPLPSQERFQILQTLPDTGVSVKSLRNLVSTRLNKNESQDERKSHKANLKNMTENLEKLKQQMNELNLNYLEQSETWSLLGAFRSLSDEMSELAKVLSKSKESRYSLKQANTNAILSEPEESHAP